MNIGELIERLEDIQEEYGEDTRVRIAMQPSWPLASILDCVTLLKPKNEKEGVTTVWLATGGHPPEPESVYAPRSAWNGGDQWDDDGDEGEDDHEWKDDE